MLREPGVKRVAVRPEHVDEAALKEVRSSIKYARMHGPTPAQHPCGDMSEGTVTCPNHALAACICWHLGIRSVQKLGHGL